MATELVGKVDVASAFRNLSRDQVPFSLALGLTKTAQRVQGDVERSLPRNLDRPTPFTQRAIAIKPASKRNLAAYVFVKDRQATYLAIQEQGGTRTPRRRALVVPSGVRLNQYGNMTRGRVRRLLSRKDVFSGRVGQTEGIWQRMKGGRLKLLVRYAKRAQYTKRLGFRQTALRSFNLNVVERIKSAVSFASSTSR